MNTVKELITHLKKFPLDSKINILTNGHNRTIILEVRNQEDEILGFTSSLKHVYKKEDTESSPQKSESINTFSSLWATYYRMSWMARYNIYLNSERWKVKRQKVLERDDSLCQSCLIEPATQVHHLTYARAGNEPLFDLTSACKDCHEIITRDTRINNEQKFKEKYIFGSLIDWFIQELDIEKDELFNNPDFKKFTDTLANAAWLNQDL